MSNIDKRALREAVERAGQNDWEYVYTSDLSAPGRGYITVGGAEAIYCLNKAAGGVKQSENILRYIAAASPETMLALLDELEAAEERIAELEGGAFNPAILDVVAERQRQQSVEGWTPEHDNAYQNSELADAAACYAIHAHNQGFSTPAHWPWSPDWWKQSGARRDLVKAGALILAEIERIDRAAGIGVKGE
ncbi:ead/Ea22-like family protein [Escherichia coli]|uniref:ead/Ea22-like family protein n=1 Tax=Escherichia coli TaxID=562 RepID=UPI001F0683DF|nr:ead/Ea22-like family protein [Escherichia coli]MCH2685512.1 ead/Ea22-like family protein [Escherichia coli]